LRGGDAPRLRDHRRSRPPPRTGRRREDAVLQPGEEDGAGGVTSMARSAKSQMVGRDPGPAERELAAMMRGYLDGRLEAFDGLYAALAPRLRAYLVSLCRDGSVADDLLQESFMQIHRSRRTYEPGRPVSPWVFAIARHVFLMHKRSTSRRVRFL